MDNSVLKERAALIKWLIDKGGNCNFRYNGKGCFNYRPVELDEDGFVRFVNLNKTRRLRAPLVDISVELDPSNECMCDYYAFKEYGCKFQKLCNKVENAPFSGKVVNKYKLNTGNNAVARVIELPNGAVLAGCVSYNTCVAVGINGVCWGSYPTHSSQRHIQLFRNSEHLTSDEYL